MSIALDVVKVRVSRNEVRREVGELIACEIQGGERRSKTKRAPE